MVSKVKDLKANLEKCVTKPISFFNLTCNIFSSFPTKKKKSSRYLKQMMMQS